jgi:hypothetical protein
MYGEVTAHVAEEMRKPETADFFARMIQRTSPKSYAQAMAETVVTRRFFENFCGDQVCPLTVMQYTTWGACPDGAGHAAHNLRCRGACPSDHHTLTRRQPF